MANNSKQDFAVTAANTLISICQQLSSLRSQVNEFVNRYNSEAYNTTWGNFATAAQNTDGSLGAADGSPNTAHPIDTRVITALNKAVTQTMLVSGVNMIEQLQKFLTNQAVSTANYSVNVDDLAN